MKTVMKKMFCLLLVAVLMVGAMPFQAFADELTTTAHLNIGDSVETVTAARPESWTASVNDIIVQWFGADPARFSNATLESNGSMNYDANLSTQVSAGETIHIRLFETTAPQKCDTCGNDVHESPCCSKCKVIGHNDVNHCAHCDSLEHLATDHCSVCKSLTCDGINHCTICNQPNHTAALHCSVCAEYGCAATNHCAVCAAKDHATAACPYCAVCYAKGDKQVTSHATAAHCSTCDSINGHKTTCTNYSAPVNGSYSLNIFAKLWVGETLNKTILLDTITGLSGDAVVPYVISDNAARLQAKFPSDYNNIEWTKAVYYDIDAKTTGVVDTRMKVSEENNVFINLYSTEKLVVVRVHTGKTYAVDRSVQVGGFRVGETVTYNDVLKAVQKYYNVSTMKMYTYDEWEKVVNGKTGATTPNFVVHEGDNVYEVYLTGSAKTSSTTSNKKADSSNPKTGDMIFVPAAVLVTSVSALAVLFYLNKKRAY